MLRKDFTVDPVQVAVRGARRRLGAADRRRASNTSSSKCRRQGRQLLRVLTALYNVILLRLFIGYPGTDTHGLKSIDAECAGILCKAALTTDEVFQTEIVLLAWRLGITIDEIPVDISEMRTAPVTVLRRVPKVLDTVRQLKKSLQRFPERETCSLVAGGLSKKATGQEEEMLGAMKDKESPAKSVVRQIS